jgi:DNA-binding protein HU-beta
MYKTEFIRRIARETRLSQRIVSDVVDAAQRLIEQTLRDGQRVTLPGFGTFYTRKRAAGKVKHIRTGKEISVPARTLAAFHVGEVLKRAVAGQRRRKLTQS